jgi:hypothetical protein
MNTFMMSDFSAANALVFKEYFMEEAFPFNPSPLFKRFSELPVWKEHPVQMIYSFASCDVQLFFPSQESKLSAYAMKNDEAFYCFKNEGLKTDSYRMGTWWDAREKRYKPDLIMRDFSFNIENSTIGEFALLKGLVALTPTGKKLLFATMRAPPKRDGGRLPRHLMLTWISFGDNEFGTRAKMGNHVHSWR